MKKKIFLKNFISKQYFNGIIQNLNKNQVFQGLKGFRKKINLISRKDRSSIPNTRVALQNINSEISNVLKQELTSLELSTSRSFN